MFTNRAEAGRQLAARLASMTLDRPAVYALPRGGVPVAVEISRALEAPLDLVMVRKIGAPSNPEVALGAVVEGAVPQTVLNEDVRRISGADEAYIERARTRELAEMERRRALYLGDRERLDPTGRTAVLVDDGLATGATMKAAIAAIRRQGAARIVAAIPVAPEDTLVEIAALADDVVCLIPSRAFRGVGGFFADFHQLTDEETIGLLRQA
ncbi:phosphoribosyltransferase [Stappia taiwanensis]|nr:phosphoribosyltransferase [Stappia taiwanensis]